MTHLQLGAHDVIDAIAKKRELDARERDRKIEEAKAAMETVFPEDVREWNINHVGQWLDALVLGQYKPAFEEAAIDGMYLLELVEQDLTSALGMTHEVPMGSGRELEGGASNMHSFVCLVTSNSCM